MKRLILVLLAWLLASPALAQSPPFPATLPANTVVGRLGISAGPAQAIPISTLVSGIFTTGFCTTAGAFPIYNASQSRWVCSTVGGVGSQAVLDGRLTLQNNTLNFDLAGSSTTANILFNTPSITVVDNKNFYFNRISLSDGNAIPITVGANGVVAGSAHYFKLTGSSAASSAGYSHITQIDNEGPGTTKAGYFRARGLSGSGVVVGLVSAINWVASTTSPWVMESDATSGPDDKAVMWMWQASGGSRLVCGICQLNAIKFTSGGSVYRAWIDQAGSGSGARAFQILRTDGTEIATWAKAGELFATTLGFLPGLGTGGAVTQITSRTTGVTLDKMTGAITLFSAAGSATPASFTVSNAVVLATDSIIINQKSGTDLYEIFITNISNGSFKVTFFTTGGTTTEQPVFNYTIIRGVNS